MSDFLFFMQAAATRALNAGATLDKVLTLVKEARLETHNTDRKRKTCVPASFTRTVLGQVTPTLKAPLVLFTYYNPILRRGVENFVKELSQAGVSGGCCFRA